MAPPRPDAAYRLLHLVIVEEDFRHHRVLHEKTNQLDGGDAVVERVEARHARFRTHEFVFSHGPNIHLDSLSVTLVVVIFKPPSRMGEAMSTSLEIEMDRCSHRSAVWPPPVDAVALLGCVTPMCADVSSIQP